MARCSFPFVHDNFGGKLVVGGPIGNGFELVGGYALIPILSDKVAF